METININKNYAEGLAKAVEVIKNGGMVLCPTDTVYILAVDPTNQEAVNKLIGFKDRWPGKAISVAVSTIERAKVLANIDTKIQNTMESLLPGPFTLVVNGRHVTAKGIEAENGTIGIRIPNNKWIADLTKLLPNGVTATSANLSGRTPHYSVSSLWKTLSKKKREMIDLIIDGGKLPLNKPSTVIDIANGGMEILRRGDLLVEDGERFITNDEKETIKLAEYVWNKQTININADKPIVFLLTGDLGGGKTVFSRSLGKILGVKEKITSPTFVIYNEYKINYELRFTNYEFKKYLHFDMYRIRDGYELEEIKFWDNFVPGTVIAIEWPENIGQDNIERIEQLAKVVKIGFEYKGETVREIKVI